MTRLLPADTSLRTILICSLVLLAEVLFLACVWFSVIDFEHVYAHIDLAQYRIMAQTSPHISPVVPAPFAYRIFPPYLIGLFFGNDATGFRVLTIITMMMVSLQLLRLLLLIGSRVPTSLTLASVMLFNPYLSGLILFDYFQLCDALSLLFMLLMLEAIIREKPLLFAVVLLFGSATREVTLIMIAVSVTCFLSRSDKRLVINFLLASLPALLLFVFLRLVLVVSNPEWSLSAALSQYSSKLFSPITWVRILLNSFTPVALLPFLFYRDSITFFRENLHYLMLLFLVTVSSFFGADTERLMAPAFIVVIILVAGILEKTELLKSIPFILVLALATIVSSMHFIVATVAIQDKILYYSACILCQVLLVLAAMPALRTQGTANTVVS